LQRPQKPAPWQAGVTEGVTVSMEIEQLIYEAGRLHDAASLLNRLSQE
jgi:hypothetical protein